MSYFEFDFLVFFSQTASDLRDISDSDVSKLKIFTLVFSYAIVNNNNQALIGKQS